MRNQIIAFSLMSACICANANAFDFVDDTYLLNVKQGTTNSVKMRFNAYGGYESAMGSMITFDKWYTPKWIDSQIDFMTQVNKKLGIIWGFSTGEHGEKYRIDPSLKLGAIFATELSSKSLLMVRGHYTFSGKLREKSCTADYGEIGGVQEVNCRMAASILPPSETLKYKFNDKPIDFMAINVVFQYKF